MNRIRLLREKAGMKQSELGKLLNVKDAAISKYETGKIPLTADTLTSLSEIFNVSVDYILGRSDESKDTSISPVLTNNVGRSFRYWIDKTGLDRSVVAKRLGISQDLLEDYMSGAIALPYNILISLSNICEVSTDCLLGLHDKSRAADLNNALPFRYNYQIAERIRLLCEKHGITQEYLQDLLSLSENEVYYLIEYGFVPHMSTVTKLADFFNVSCDYLLCQIGDQDEKAAMAFRLLTEDNKDIIVGEIKKALREQKREGAVAAEMPLKEVK